MSKCELCPYMYADRPCKDGPCPVTTDRDIADSMMKKGLQ